MGALALFLFIFDLFWAGFEPFLGDLEDLELVWAWIWAIFGLIWTISGGFGLDLGHFGRFGPRFGPFLPDLAYFWEFRSWI